MMLRPLLFLLTGLVLASKAAFGQSPTPVGVWLHDNKRIQIEIAPCEDELCAKIIWLLRPHDAEGQPLSDFRNPDAALRKRPVLGLTILEGLRRTGENSWEEGRIYNPDDGGHYRARMSIGADGSLLVRAYVFMPWFGRTFVWTRVR